MATQPLPRISPEEYVALEQQLGVKHEYHDGQVFAMAGASRTHSRLQVNITVEVDNRLRAAACSVYSSDFRVVVEKADLATYPDLSVVCGKVESANAFKHSCINPTVLIEVLSPSTERYDRGVKFDQYRKLNSLREYVLISQDAMAIDLYRLDSGLWVFHPLRGEDAMHSLASVGIEIPLRDIYRGVNFEDAE